MKLAFASLTWIGLGCAPEVNISNMQMALGGASLEEGFVDTINRPNEKIQLDSKDGEAALEWQWKNIQRPHGVRNRPNGY